MPYHSYAHNWGYTGYVSIFNSYYRGLMDIQCPPDDIIEYIERAEHLTEKPCTSRLSGVYLLYESDNVVYVGQTSNFSKRLVTEPRNWSTEYEHDYHRHFHKCDTYVLYPVKNRQTIDDIEGALIGYYNPPYNEVNNRQTLYVNEVII